MLELYKFAGNCYIPGETTLVHFGINEYTTELPLIKPIRDSCSTRGYNKSMSGYNYFGMILKNKTTLPTGKVIKILKRYLRPFCRRYKIVRAKERRHKEYVVVFNTPKLTIKELYWIMTWVRLPQLCPKTFEIYKGIDNYIPGLTDNEKLFISMIYSEYGYMGYDILFQNYGSLYNLSRLKRLLELIVDSTTICPCGPNFQYDGVLRRITFDTYLDLSDNPPLNINKRVFDVDRLRHIIATFPPKCRRILNLN